MRVIVFGVVLVGVISLGLVLRRWDTVPVQDRSGSPEAATGHMQPWHHGLIHGTKGDDVLYGTEAGERIEALAGRDVIIARGGNDELDGGHGADVLMGGPGDDIYIVQHHGDGPDVIVEESGNDTLRIVGGPVDRNSVQVLRHGDDLLVRWTHDQPDDAVLIRSWFLGPQYHVERLELPDGTVVALEPLAERATVAGLEDLLHFPSPPPSVGSAPP